MVVFGLERAIRFYFSAVLHRIYFVEVCAIFLLVLFMSCVWTTR